VETSIAGDMLVRTFRLVQHDQKLGKLNPSTCHTSPFTVWTGSVTDVFVTFVINILTNWQVSLTITVRTLIKDPDLYHCTSFLFLGVKNKKPAVAGRLTEYLSDRSAFQIVDQINDSQHEQYESNDRHEAIIGQIDHLLSIWTSENN
jgi:hypothetical protein